MDGGTNRTLELGFFSYDLSGVQGKVTLHCCILTRVNWFKRRWKLASEKPLFRPNLPLCQFLIVKFSLSKERETDCLSSRETRYLVLPDKKIKNDSRFVTFFQHSLNWIRTTLIHWSHYRYGDKTPKFVLGRMFGVLWILLGLVVIAMFTATATSAFNIDVDSLARVTGQRVNQNTFFTRKIYKCNSPIIMT